MDSDSPILPATTKVAATTIITDVVGEHPSLLRRRPRPDRNESAAPGRGLGWDGADVDDTAIRDADTDQQPGDEAASAVGPTTSDDEPRVRNRRDPGADVVVSVDSVQAYFKQIARIALLTAAQEVDLARRIEVGLFAAERRRCSIDADEPVPAQLRGELEWLVRDGEHARTHLLEANLRLVVSIAKRYTGRGMPLLDLIQEGNLGLIRAVEKFDGDKGYKFSTYATWWIRQSIARALADQARIIRLPVHMVEILNSLDHTRRDLLQELGRPPTAAELAAATGLTPEKVHTLQQRVREPVSLDQTIGPDSDLRLGDLIEDPHAVAALDAVSLLLLHAQLDAVLATLSAREAGIVRLRFGLADGESHTLDEIGKVYGVTRERIRQIESTTMTKLRQPSRCYTLRGYLEEH
jgi:RNA polymerase primary sigma factor